MDLRPCWFLPATAVQALGTHFLYSLQLRGAQELSFLKCKHMEASRSVEAIRGFSSSKQYGLALFGVWLFLLIFIFHLGFVRLSALFSKLCSLLLVAGACKTR